MRQDSSNASSNDNPVITSYFTPFPFCYLADTNNRKELKKKKKKADKANNFQIHSVQQKWTLHFTEGCTTNHLTPYLTQNN